jgi:fumarate reductase flavoprotein subunit
MITRTPDGALRIDYRNVVITRWPPGERIYGQSTEAVQAVKA